MVTNIDIQERMARLRLLKEKNKISQDRFQKGSPGYKKQKESLEDIKYKQKNIGTEARIKREEKKLSKAKIKRFTQSADKFHKASGRVFEKVVGAVKFRPQASRQLLSYANAFNEGSSTGSQGQSSRGPGRPRGSLKHRSPFNGAPITAPEFYKQLRAFRRIQSQKADQVELQRQVQFAQRGVAPNRIQNVVEQRMRQQFEMQQMQNQPRQINQVPQRMPPQPIQQRPMQQVQMQRGQVVSLGIPVWKWIRGIVDTQTDIMGNQRQILRGAPQSFWN